MEMGHWLTLAIFITGNLFTLVGVIVSTRIDTNKLKDKMADLATDMAGIQVELKQFGNILITLADFKGEMNLMQDRLMAWAKRLDEHIKESNEREKRMQDLCRDHLRGGE